MTTARAPPTLLVGEVCLGKAVFHLNLHDAQNGKG